MAPLTAWLILFIAAPCKRKLNYSIDIQHFITKLEMKILINL